MCPVDVWITKISIRDTGQVINAIKTIPNIESVGLLHLRRVAKSDFLPDFLRTDGLLDQKSLYILLAPTNLISHQALQDLLETGTTAFSNGSEHRPDIRAVPVPLHPPTSLDHASQLSSRYWPTIFTNTNPFGPHPSLVARAQHDLSQSAGHWMCLAKRAADEASTTTRGLSVGVAIVSPPDPDGMPEVPAVVAGDARFAHPCAPSLAGQRGNPAGHAVMRAIALVAQKRLAVSGVVADAADSTDVNITSTSPIDSQLTPLEREFFDAPTLKPGGYLCLDMRVYVTHEPCLQCSMALVHSRVGAVVFGRDMPATGGMYAQRPADSEGPGHARPNLRYGLFWREDLNWRFLSWQWTPVNDERVSNDRTQHELPQADFAELPWDTHV